MIEKLYTVEEVAELASVTGRTIRNYLKSGRLVGRKIGGQWRFPENEVQRLLTGADTADPEPEEDDDSPQDGPVFTLQEEE
ncbi:helix-turn-helix domain-containing protein, partial [Ruminococcaceae bacterium OttesenSCG-928-I18]|nr:helix-turn-helix domain-containing protein [Ruminococcaceae bacterium OttesenSCG-928-I18]